MTKKKTKLSWWNLPQTILDKAVEDGVNFRIVDWYVEINEKGERNYVYEGR